MDTILHLMQLEHENINHIQFLCVDDFGVEFFTKKDVDHLMHALEQLDKLYIDWEGKYHCDFNLHWNYKDNYVNAAIPQFIP